MTYAARAAAHFGESIEEMTPIWRDYIVNLDDGTDPDFAGQDGINYIVCGLDGSPLYYSGRAVRRPTGEITVTLNDICRPYLSAPVPQLADGAFTAYVLPTFRLDRYTDAGAIEEDYDDVDFLPDWSYDYDRDYSAALLSAPINGRVDPRQMLPVTVARQSQVDFLLAYADGTTETVSVPAAPADFSADFSADFFVAPAKTGTAVLDLSTRPGLASVTVLGQTYGVVQPCHGYALMYRNAHGGWDTFLLEGSVVPADGYDRMTMTRTADNVDRAARARHNYLTEVTRRWTMRTGWLRDAEVERMHHLTGSTDVYLYDLAQGTVVPVVLTASEAVYDTFRTNGRRPVYYELTADLAQGRERR